MHSYLNNNCIKNIKLVKLKEVKTNGQAKSPPQETKGEEKNA